MPDGNSRHLSLHLDSASGHDDSVEREPTCWFSTRSVRVCQAVDCEIVRCGGLPVQQADHWTLAAGGAQLQGLAGLERDADGLDVNSAVGDLDDGVRGVV